MEVVFLRFFTRIFPRYFFSSLLEEAHRKEVSSLGKQLEGFAVSLKTFSEENSQHRAEQKTLVESVSRLTAAVISCCEQLNTLAAQLEDLRQRLDNEN